MLLKDLVQKIKNSTALTEAQKNKCLNLIPHANGEQLHELATNIVWLEQQESTLNHEEEQMMSKLKLTFTKMNHYAVKEQKKQQLNSMEERSKAEDEGHLNSLIQDL